MQSESLRKSLSLYARTPSRRRTARLKSAHRYNGPAGDVILRMEADA